MIRVTRWVPVAYFLLAFSLAETLAQYPRESSLAVLGRVCWQTALCGLGWYAPQTWRWLCRRACDDRATPS